MLASFNVAFALYFIAITICGGNKRITMRWFIIPTSAFVILNLLAKLGIPWYFGSYLALDNGIGG